MGIVIFIAVVVFAAIALLWVVDRRNPGDFRTNDMSAHDKGGTDKGWHGRVDPERGQGRS